MCAAIWSQFSENLDVESCEALFGCCQGFFPLAERKTYLRSAVLRVVVKAGTGDARDANFLNQIFGESDVFCLRSEAGIVLREMEAGNVGHDVISAARFVNGETGGCEDFEQALALPRVGQREFVVIRLGRAQCDGAGLLKRRGRADGQKVVDLANGLR